jgi:glycogen debranching enzyme
MSRLPASLEVPLLGDSPIDVHPGLVLAHSGYTVLLSRHDGSLEAEGREGLYDFDTRLLSRYVLKVDDRRPLCVADGTPLADRWIGHLRVPLDGGDATGPRLPEDSLEVIIWRRLGPGMAERLELINHSMASYEGKLSIELEADFADVHELNKRRQQGKLQASWDAASRSLAFDYLATHDEARFERSLRVVVASADSQPQRRGTTLSFALDLEPRGSWSAELRYESQVDGEWRVPPSLLDDDGSWIETERDRQRADWHRRRTHLDTGHHVLAPAFERAADDLFALRAWELDVSADAWVPHAGVPIYTGLFGRDSLTSGWQSLLISDQLTRGALELVARTQAKGDDAWRDEEPGKMIHEMRRGPLAELGITPLRAYYGTYTTPAMFVLGLSELWHWTADAALLRRHRDAAMRGLEWAHRYGDSDGDGFLEYATRSPAGLKNQGWKDSDEAIRYPDGSLVENPISTLEEQAFHCIALERMAEILLVLDEGDEAQRLIDEARTFRRRWHEAFWMEEEGFYAMALDGAKEQVRSIGSNPGHALGTGIVPAEQARQVADRLLAPDLFSGWGVRTLSGEHPSYNPYGYHLGPVWPVENATFALGFKRYGLDDHVERLVEGMCAAAAAFQGCRLPEALGGHRRTAGSLPTIYPGSNSPQAWSASAMIQLVQTMLGLYPFAATRLLALVRPRLPAWLDSLTLRNVRVADATVALRFERGADGVTRWDVVERDGLLVVLEVPPPDDVSGGADAWQAQLAMWFLEHAPGRLARAARLALGQLD